MTSRRPKKCASNEYAPGPSIASAAATVAARSTVNLAQNMLGAIAADHESQKPLSDKSTLTAGLSNPIRSKTPLAIWSEQIAQIAGVGFELPTK
jgi:hypothetical protein